MAVIPFDTLNMQTSIRALIATVCRCHAPTPLKTGKLVIQQKDLTKHLFFLGKTAQLGW